MATLDQYDINNADILDDIAAAPKNPLEPSRLFAKVIEPGGMIMASPEWSLGPVASYLETMLDTTDFGNQYDCMPDKMSKELYGTHELWMLLMHVNNVANRADFRGPVLRYVRAYSIPLLLSVLKIGRDRATEETARHSTFGDLTIRKIYA